MTEKTVNSLVIERSSQWLALPLRRGFERRRLLGLTGVALGGCDLAADRGLPRRW